MKLSTEFFLRLVGAAVGAVSFGLFGERLAIALNVSSPYYVLISGLVGILIGLILTPYVTTRPMRMLRRLLISMAPERLVAIVIGTFLGLLATALVSPILSLLPTPFREITPLIAAFLFIYSSVVILTLRQNDLRAFLSNLSPIWEGVDRNGSSTAEEENCILLDTSVIIDGRIVDIGRSGFIRSTLLVPNFILLELQHIADSADSLRRNRGRRGLDILNMLQKDSPVPVRITDMDVSEVREADSKLVALARHLHCPIMTNDYNLNRVAELQGVTVLNINDLANAVKAIYLPGEDLSVKVIQEGKEEGQGVGFLEDGTMVVIEEGRDYLQNTITVTVTKVLQTTAGRMIFARVS